VPQFSSYIAYRQSISPTNRANQLLDPGRKREEGTEAGIEGLLAQVGVVGVVSDLSAICASIGALWVHLANTTALLQAALIVD
jgi:hypothetical protein